MGRFKDLEIPQKESEQVENLTLFEENVSEPIPGYSKSIRYFADAKSYLAFIDLKIKQQRSKNHSKAA